MSPDFGYASGYAIGYAAGYAVAVEYGAESVTGDLAQTELEGCCPSRRFVEELLSITSVVCRVDS